MAFSELGEVSLLPGWEIDNRNLRDCQCLVVRAVTRVDQKLLQDTAVEFVATATIGTDHIDLEYLKQNNIGFSNAAGCNAEAVAEYVISGLFALSEQFRFDPFDLTAGIIGHGNTGSRLHDKLKVLGIETLVCDPPLAQKRQGEQNFVDLDRIISDCDFISLHVPLSHDSDHPTFHLVDHSRLQALRENCILVNSARGPVIDNQALLKVMQTREDLIVFLDTWENEPEISSRLLDQVSLATPHIAGYGVEGRLRGTQMALDATCNHFSKSSSWKMSQYLPEIKTIETLGSSTDLEFWQHLFRQHHDIRRDHLALTDSGVNREQGFAAHFESLRKVYPERLEYERFRLSSTPNKKAASIARRLLFKK